MSNFNAFSPEHIQRLIDPFIPGMAAHITPIKYEALTPDAFMLLFRTTDQSSNEHFFVSYEFDYVGNVTRARKDIADWHGEILELIPPANTTLSISDETEIKDIQQPTRSPYYALLARVVKPRGNGYWSSSTLIMPGDSIGDKIKDYSPEVQANVRKTLTKILQHKTDASLSFAESLKAKKKDTIVDDRNMTDMSVKLFVKPDNSIECFYNYATPTVGNRESNTSLKADD